MKVKMSKYTDSGQEVKVRIDYWDTWNMDVSLAHIILPMLKQMVDDKQGAPNVDCEDVPEELRVTDAELESYKQTGETDTHFFDRWNWVLNEMIYSFETKVSDEDVLSQYYTVDKLEEAKKVQERISNGFRLFGKYYEALWT